MLATGLDQDSKGVNYPTDREGGGRDGERERERDKHFHCLSLLGQNDFVIVEII